jgi:hypothetical protein
MDNFSGSTLAEKRSNSRQTLQNLNKNLTNGAIRTPDYESDIFNVAKQFSDSGI